MNKVRTSARALRSVIPTLLLATGACTSDDGRPASEDMRVERPESEAAEQDATGGRDDIPVTFTEADLDAFERGLRREVEAVRAAQRRSGTAKTPEGRGAAIQDAFEHATMPIGAEAAGLPLDRYRAIRETVMRTFRILDFQGTIDGPMQMDLSRASAAQKEELSRDPFTTLPGPSAAALRARMDRLVPVWLEYIGLTAVAG